MFIIWLVERELTRALLLIAVNRAAELSFIFLNDSIKSSILAALDVDWTLGAINGFLDL
jgi:hypothetical protein